jgi:hypothetical protein
MVVQVQCDVAGGGVEAGQFQRSLHAVTEGSQETILFHGMRLKVLAELERELQQLLFWRSTLTKG